MKKNIISFSVYGEDPIYQIGAVENLTLAKTVYPGWICRFYVSHEIPESIIQRLHEGGGEIIHRNRNMVADGMFWRFDAAFDPNIAVLIVRDTDSRLGIRERHAVDEWLASNYDFHIMRDHPYHSDPILGGMWGARGAALDIVKQKINSFKFDNECVYGDDQQFLAREVYSTIRDNAMIHSECHYFFGERSKNFPTLLGNCRDFVGRVHPVEAGASQRADKARQNWIDGNIRPRASIFPKPSLLSRQYWRYWLWKCSTRYGRGIKKAQTKRRLPRI